jgi:uncharacterized membrane protein HdeD (DUF308 family)
MRSLLARYWWSLTLRGLFLLIFGLIALTAPNMSTETLVLYLGFLSVSMALLFGFVGWQSFRRKMIWWPFLLLTLLDVVIAYYCLFNTAFAANIFLLIIGSWALFMGAAIILIGLRSSGTGRVLIIINGSLSVAFSMFIFFNPLKSTAVNFMVGFYTILLSLFLLYLSYRVAKMGNTPTVDADALEGGEKPHESDQDAI